MDYLKTFGDTAEGWRAKTNKILENLKTEYDNLETEFNGCLRKKELSENDEKTMKKVMEIEKTMKKIAWLIDFVIENKLFWENYKS